MEEPKFVETDPIIIEQEVLSKFVAALGKELYPAQLERLLVDVAALLSVTAAMNVNETGKQNLLSFAVGNNLDQIGELTATPRLTNGYARSTARFSFTPSPSGSAFLVPQGTQLSAGTSGGLVFETERDLIIPALAAYGDVNIRAVEVGETYNGLAAGTITTIASIVPDIPMGLVLQVTNLETTQGGLISELDEPYRQRLKLAPNKFSTAGSGDAYKFWALSAHPSIIDVEVDSPSPVYARVYILTDAGVPNEAILDDVYDVLDGEKVRPITDIVQVEAATPVEYAISIAIIADRNSSLSTLRSEVERVALEYATELRRKLGADFIRAELRGRVQAVSGVYNQTLTAPTIDIEISLGEFASLTSISVEVVAVEGQ